MDRKHRKRTLWTLPLLASAIAWALAAAAPAGATAPPGRFEISTNGTPDDPTDDTVLDVKTQLRWQRMFSPLVTWDPGAGPGSAQAYCASLSVGSYTSGWRLPGLKELVSIVDVRSHPAYDARVFPKIALWIESGNTPRFWSATPAVTSATIADGGATVYASAWVIGPGSGHSIPWTATKANIARCVRAP